MPDTREMQFLTLVHANDSRLRRICRVYERDAEVRKDLYQEIMFQLWRALPSFGGASTVDTWIYRVALNTALAHVRRQSNRRETMPLDDEHSESEAVSTTSDSEDELPELDEQSERLHAAIQRLDGIDRMLVTMQLDGRSYREMAEVIGITESNVGVKLHRIRKALARMLAKETV